MSRAAKDPRPGLEKSPTGIEGFDAITRGGLPSGRTTLIAGGPGSGKTLFALETLVHGARALGEPGIFVAFEESSARIVANASGFGWDLPSLQTRKLFLLDAQPSAELLQSGDFDLVGLLATLEAKATEMGARRIVFDSIDMVLALLGERAAERREMHRLHEWLLDCGLTGVITAKDRTEIGGGSADIRRTRLQFLVDCAVTLNHRMVDGVSQRSLRVLKYRGSEFAENEAPMAIGPAGFEVADSDTTSKRTFEASTERVSSGVERLDAMLGGGYFRGASILVTGAPGTAKTTLGGAFARAALKRREKVLFVSFDSEPEEIVRNLGSVGIDLAGSRRNGALRMMAMQATSGSAELHFLRLRRIARE